MKLVNLLAMLHDLPVGSLEKEVFLEYSNGDIVGGKLKVEPINSDDDDPTIIGYVLVEDKQLNLPFDKE